MFKWYFLYFQLCPRTPRSFSAKLRAPINTSAWGCSSPGTGICISLCRISWAPSGPFLLPVHVPPWGPSAIPPGLYHLQTCWGYAWSCYPGLEWRCAVVLALILAPGVHSDGPGLQFSLVLLITTLRAHFSVYLTDCLSSSDFITLSVRMLWEAEIKVKMLFIGKKTRVRESKRIEIVDLIRWAAQVSCMPQCHSSFVKSPKDITA